MRAHTGIEREATAGTVPEADPQAAQVLTCPGYDQGPRWQPGERLQDLFEARCDAMAAEPGHAAVEAAGTGGVLPAARRAGQPARPVPGGPRRSPGDRIALLFDQAVHVLCRDAGRR